MYRAISFAVITVFVYLQKRFLNDMLLSWLCFVVAAHRRRLRLCLRRCRRRPVCRRLGFVVAVVVVVVLVVVNVVVVLLFML